MEKHGVKLVDKLEEGPDLPKSKMPVRINEE